MAAIQLGKFVDASWRTPNRLRHKTPVGVTNPTHAELELVTKRKIYPLCCTLHLYDENMLILILRAEGNPIRCTGTHSIYHLVLSLRPRLSRTFCWLCQPLNHLGITYVTGTNQPVAGNNDKRAHLFRVPYNAQTLTRSKRAS